MMEFLDKIYGSENFGIILFAVIMVLVVLFLVILFFGKKDEKKRKIERTQALEKQAMDGFAETNVEGVAVETTGPTFAPVEEIIAPVTENAPVEPIVPMAETVNPVMEPLVEEVTPMVQPAQEEVTPVLEPVVEPSIIMPSEPEVQPTPIAEVINPVIEPEVKLEPVNMPAPESVTTPITSEEPKVEIEIPKFNFDELAASIANELQALENNNVVAETPVEEVKVEPIPTVNNDVPVTPINEVVRPVVEQPKPTPGPVTFSSVYINKPAEPVVPAEPIQPVAPAPVSEVVVEPVVAPTPVQVNPMPNIELPKPAEMPILKEEVQPAPVNNPAPVVPDFSQFEGESYDIK